MAIIDDFVLPAVLTGFVRQVPGPATYTLNQFLPDHVVPSIDAAIDSVTQVNRAATFRSFDAETPIGKRDSFQRSRINLPPLGQKTVIGEYDRLILERLRTGGSNDDPIVEAIYDDAANNTRAVLARMEVARGDVLVDGKFTLDDENGLTLEADFGVDPDQLVTAPVLWSDYETADPIGDLDNWINSYNDLVGEDPGNMLVSRQVLNNMLRCEAIRQLAAVGAVVPPILNRAILNQVLQANGIPAVTEYNTRIDVNGQTVFPVPQDTLMLLPANPDDLGETAWGVTAEALELATGSNPQLTATEAPGLVGVVMRDGDPVRTWTKVGAVGMPIIKDPRRLWVATVL